MTLLMTSIAIITPYELLTIHSNQDITPSTLACSYYGLTEEYYWYTIGILLKVD